MTPGPSSPRLPSTSHRVGAVIVTYHPGDGVEARLLEINRQVSAVVIVDNSAVPDVRARLKKAADAIGAELVSNPSNLGLATALNTAFARLRGLGFSHVIAFDQDSTPQPNFTSALLQATDDSTAVVGANWRDEARPAESARQLQAHALPIFFRRTVVNDDVADVTCVITSGSLFNLRIWQELGGFDESLFLDLVDTDYCLRAQAAGYRVRVAGTARLLHRRGAKTPTRVAGRVYWPAFMPEARLYYVFRNRIPVGTRELLRRPHWVTFELAYAAKILANVVFLEDRKLSKLAACLHGTWDGLVGRGGPRERAK